MRSLELPVSRLEVSKSGQAATWLGRSTEVEEFGTDLKRFGSRLKPFGSDLKDLGTR